MHELDVQLPAASSAALKSGALAVFMVYYNIALAYIASLVQRASAPSVLQTLNQFHDLFNSLHGATACKQNQISPAEHLTWEQLVLFARAENERLGGALIDYARLAADGVTLPAMAGNVTVSSNAPRLPAVLYHSMIDALQRGKDRRSRCVASVFSRAPFHGARRMRFACVAAHGMPQRVFISPCWLRPHPPP